MTNVSLDSDKQTIDSELVIVHRPLIDRQHRGHPRSACSKYPGDFSVRGPFGVQRTFEVSAAFFVEN